MKGGRQFSTVVTIQAKEKKTKKQIKAASFPEAAATNYHMLMAENNKTTLCHNFGDQELKSRCL